VSPATKISCINRLVFAINIEIAVHINWQLSLLVLAFDMERVSSFLRAVYCVNDSKCSSGKMVEFRHESLLCSFGENCLKHSRFWGVLSNSEANSNLFIVFQYPSMNFNRNRFKIQIKKIVQKSKKRQGVLLAFFRIFGKKKCLKFHVITIENRRGTLKKIKNDVGCFII